MFKLTCEEYQEACENYQGICLSCGQFRDNTEPDAEGYDCEFCEQNKVIGIENALLLGEIEVL